MLSLVIINLQKISLDEIVINIFKIMIEWKILFNFQKKKKIPDTPKHYDVQYKDPPRSPILGFNICINQRWLDFSYL